MVMTLGAQQIIMYAASRFRAGRDGGKIFQKKQNQTTLTIPTTVHDNLLYN